MSHIGWPSAWSNIKYEIENAEELWSHLGLHSRWGCSANEIAERPCNREYIPDTIA